MSETYAEIMRDLKKHHYERAADYCKRHDVDLSDTTTSYFHDAVCDVARRVRDAVAGEPSLWYQLDKFGNELHIGDKAMFGDIAIEVASLGTHFAAWWDGCSYSNCDTRCLEKVIPDTQEKIDTDYKKLKSDAEMNVLASGVFGADEVKDLLDGFNAILERQRKLDGAWS